jgi:hypothetical protein
VTTAQRRSRIAASCIVTLGIVALVAGCGIRTDSEPRAISGEAVPYDLLDPTTSSGPTTTTTPAATARGSIYLVNSDGFLTPVDREVRDPVEVADVLDSLLNGATDAEANRGLRSAITRTTELLGTRLDIRTRVLNINLTGDLLDVAGEEQRLALAQVVYTATALGAVQSVVFQFDDKLTPVPDAEGATKSTPLERRDYFNFDAARATTTTVAPASAPESSEP